MLFKISNFRFRELVKNHIDLSELYLLECAYNKLNLEEFKERKIFTLIQGLKRKEYIDQAGIITEEGRKLYESLLLPDKEELVLGRIEDKNDDFEKFWKSYPATDSIILDGKILFKGSRSLKVDKEACKIKFLKILAEGEHTTEDLIKAIQYEVGLKIEKSIKEKKNGLSYMKASSSWLNQRAFEGFIEEAKIAEIKPIKKPTNWDTIA